jgi:hypothetical protein
VKKIASLMGTDSNRICSTSIVVKLYGHSGWEHLKKSGVNARITGCDILDYFERLTDVESPGYPIYQV